LLDKTSSILKLSDLGMHDERIKLLNKLIKSPYGIILVTGPTGSGKTDNAVCGAFHHQSSGNQYHHH